VDFLPDDLDASISLIALLSFPFDQERRRQYCVTQAVRMYRLATPFLEALEAVRGPIEARDRFLKECRQVINSVLLEPRGGLAALPPSGAGLDPFKDASENLLRVMSAGRMLRYIVSLREHNPRWGSQRQALSLLTGAADSLGYPIPPKREASALWRRFGQAAPLAAAVLAFIERRQAAGEMFTGIGRGAETVSVLSWAAWYDSYARNQKLWRTRKDVLLQGPPIVLPPGIGPEPPNEPPLSPPLLKLARQHSPSGKRRPE
jgi:hypothetical protein